MAPFLSPEHHALAEEIAGHLITREQTLAIAESTTGGLVSAALLAVPGASKYYTGGGVTYTLNSRVQLVGMPPEAYANYRGTTPEMLTALAEAMRVKLGATWGLAESGLAGPTGGRSGVAPGRTTVAIAGPVARAELFETGLDDRAENMSQFTLLALRAFLAALNEA